MLDCRGTGGFTCYAWCMLILYWKSGLTCSILKAFPIAYPHPTLKKESVDWQFQCQCISPTRSCRLLRIPSRLPRCLPRTGCNCSLDPSHKNRHSTFFSRKCARYHKKCVPKCMVRPTGYWVRRSPRGSYSRHHRRCPRHT